MKPEAQRIAIAEEYGCKWICYNREGTGQDAPIYLLTPKDLEIKKGGRIVDPCDFTGYKEPANTVPDYLNDLNAMHEAEKILRNKPSQWMDYNAALSVAATNHTLMVATKSPDLLWEFHHATASQRTEAFLRTIGKWVES